MPRRFPKAAQHWAAFDALCWAAFDALYLAAFGVCVLAGHFSTEPPGALFPYTQRF